MRAQEISGSKDDDADSTMTVNKRGTREWWSSDDLLHRIGGPAVIGTDGTREWLVRGRYHREDGPALELPDGTKQWHLNGKDVTIPELIRLAQQGDKHTVLQQMLIPIKREFDYTLAKRLIPQLKKVGVNWPEIAMIAKSMRAIPREINEGAIQTKRTYIKDRGEVLYDGDPRDYKWRAKTIKAFVDMVEEPLRASGRRFDSLLIVKDPPERWFLATSRGAPEVIAYFYYNAGGAQSFIYVDHLRVKPQDFADLPGPEKVKLLSTQIPMDPAMVWQKERSLDLIGSALESMPKDAVDAAISNMRTKLLAAVGRMEPLRSNITKMGLFVRSLTNIGTAGSIGLAKEAMEAFKTAMIKFILTAIKESGSLTRSTARYVELLKTHFDWPELDVIEKSLLHR